MPTTTPAADPTGTNHGTGGGTTRRVAPLTGDASIILQQGKFKQNDATGYSVQNDDYIMQQMYQDALRQNPYLQYSLRFIPYVEKMKIKKVVQGTPTFFDHARRQVYAPGKESISRFHTWLWQKHGVFINLRELLFADHPRKDRMNLGDAYDAVEYAYLQTKKLANLPPPALGYDVTGARARKNKPKPKQPPTRVAAGLDNSGHSTRKLSELFEQEAGMDEIQRHLQGVTYDSTVTRDPSQEDSVKDMEQALERKKQERERELREARRIHRDEDGGYDTRGGGDARPVQVHPASKQHRGEDRDDVAKRARVRERQEVDRATAERETRRAKEYEDARRHHATRSRRGPFA